MNEQNGFPRMREVFFAYCKSVDSPISLGLWLRFEHNQLALAEFEIPVKDYLDKSAFELDYGVFSFLTKWKGLDTGLDLEAEAIRRFTSSETVCRETNKRIRRSRNIPLDGDLASIIFAAQRKIARLLGPYSTFKVDTKYGWGPGATNDIPRRRAFVDTKMCELPISVTRRALPIIRQCIAEDLHWSSVLLSIDPADLVGPFCWCDNVFVVTDECVIETVPKNAKTHRVIAKEPRANGFLQKGVGAYIRKRLKVVGIDLDDQGANQRGARAAYYDGLATLDLKAASDSMSIELVYELLPVDWALALNDLRSHSARLPGGELIRLEKFSSMGNGFTFELESLIFWALASSVKSIENGTEVLVYGDDIICPSASAQEVIDALAFSGFTVNDQKSYITGNFYESCGKHYFQGYDVTPCYQKEVIDTYEELVRAGNRLLRYAFRISVDDRQGFYRLRRELYGPWCVLWRKAGLSSSFQIPHGTEGDDGWCLPADLFDTRPQDINLGLRCRVIRSLVNRLPACDKSLLAWTLRRDAYRVEGSIPFLGVESESYSQKLQGPFLTSSPDTTKSAPIVRSERWVMPSGEFAATWNN